MITPAMYSAMIGSVLEHGQKHLNTARALCDKIATGEDGFLKRLEQVGALRGELLILKCDMERALLFFDIDEKGSAGEE